MMMNKKCAYCGKRFRTNKPYQLYCCRSCKNKALYYKKTETHGQVSSNVSYHKTCAYCGKVYIAHAIHGMYCSNACKKAAYKQPMFGDPRQGAVLSCPVCGKEFVQTKEHRIYCSFECAKIAKNNGVPKADKKSKTSYLPPSRFCHDCGCPTDDYRCPECWTKFRAKHSENFV